MEPPSQGPEAASRAGRPFAAALLVGLLVLLNGFPQWVGFWTVGPGREWRFLPLLGDGYAEHLGSLNLWLALALAVQVLLIRRGRRDRTVRWLEVAAGAVGVLTLFRLAVAPELIGPRREWLDLHGWPPRLESEVLPLVTPLLVLLKLALVGGAVILLVFTLQRLFQQAGFAAPARRLVREGLGERGLGGTIELFRRDAGHAYRVLDRDRVYGAEPESAIARFVHRSKVVLRGIAVQLSPARRLLFAVSMLLAVPDKTRGAAVAGLFFLLLLELVDRIQVRDELDLARSLQRDLLPTTAPAMPGWEVAHSYRTANAIGGDYHDFQPAGGGRMALVVGDASGHGMAAALLMAIANATLKAAVDHRPEPEAVVTQLNRALVRTGGRRAFMSVFYGLLDLGSGRLDYACAGHPFPLLRRADGEILELGTGSLPLGVREGLEVAGEATVIGPDDRLLLYSDGLAEALDGPEGEAFGFDRLREHVAPGGSARKIHDRILEAFEAHVAGQPLADDLTLVVLHRLPARG